MDAILAFKVQDERVKGKTEEERVLKKRSIVEDLLCGGESLCVFLCHSLPFFASNRVP